MKVGVVGAGRHASNTVFPAIVESGLELAAVCARRPGQSEATARRWGARTHHSTVEEMLQGNDLDGIVVVVPAREYRPIVAQCLAAGLPVFCEKPAGRTAAELRELAVLAAAANREVVVGYMKRFAPAYRRARTIIRTERFGAPTLAHFTFAMGQINDYLVDPRHYLGDNPVHMIDLARFLLGEIEVVAAVGDVAPGFGLSMSLIARAESGAACSFAFCTTASFAHRSEFAEVYGRGDAVEVRNVDTCTLRPLDGPSQTWRPNYTLPTPANSGLMTMGFVPALLHFQDVVEGRSPNESGLESAARTMETVERAWQQIAPDWAA